MTKSKAPDKPAKKEPPARRHQYDADPEPSVFPIVVDHDLVIEIRSKGPRDIGRMNGHHRMAGVTKQLRAFKHSRNGDWFVYERKHTCDGKPEVILDLHESK